MMDQLKLAELDLPEPPQPGGNYLAWQRHHRIIYLAGAISSNNGKVIQGRLGDGMTIEEGYEAAKQCARLQLAVLRQAIGRLENVARIISLNGYVRCTPEFFDAPKVINGASDFLVQVYGEKGRHVRAAVGVASLPAGAAVEIQMVVEIKEES